MFAKYIFLLLHFCALAFVRRAVGLMPPLGALYRSKGVSPLQEACLVGTSRLLTAVAQGSCWPTGARSSSVRVWTLFLTWVFDPLPLLKLLLLLMATS